MNVTDDDDPDLLAMRAELRKKRLRKVGIAAGVLALVGLYPFWNKSQAAAELAEDGYSEVDMSFKGYATFGFTANKGNATCGGTVFRHPFGNSQSVSCFGIR